MSARPPSTSAGPSAIADLDGTVDILVVCPAEIDDPVLLEAYSALLTEDERTREQAFVFAETRHTHRVTRALVRWGLSRYVPGIEPAAWRFSRSEYGRPRVEEPEVGRSLSFNLSHTAGLIVCAITAHRDVGIDVEAVDRRCEIEQIARRYFAAAEADALLELPPPSRRERFFEYWTLKEAYLKARGAGLSLPLDGFAYAFDGPSIRLRFSDLIDDATEAWQLALLEPLPGYRAALAVRRDGASCALSVRKAVPLRSAEPLSCRLIGTTAG
jgi:4'-phosphopantetheinyl transferase